MSASWSRLVAALVVMAGVLVAGSALASGASAQDRPAVGGNVGSQPVRVYEAVRPEVVPVVGSDTAGSAAAIAHIAAAHVYDGPVVSRAGASDSISPRDPFSQVTGGGSGTAPPVAEVVGTSTTPLSLTITPRGAPGSSAFHHTTSQAVDSIASKGLYPGSYATPTKGLSPLQAHIELALNPAGGARNAVLEIDLAGLRAAGYEIPQVTRVTGAYNMPGGGYEMRFPYEVPPEFIKVIQR